MALQPLNAFTTKAANFADKPSPGMSAAQVKAQFDAAPEELRVFVNSLITQLNADFALKSEIASALLGQILDGSLTDAKLSNTTGQVKDRLSKVIIDLANFIATKSVANGLAGLDGTGKVIGTQLPIQTANGSWSDTTTSIPANGSFTKTIPLGINATKGRVIVKGSGSTGAIIHFNKNDSDTIAYNGTSTDNYFYNKSLDGVLSIQSLGIFGNSIKMMACYIVGTDLIITFVNTNTTTAYGLTVAKLLWEV